MYFILIIGSKFRKNNKKEVEKDRKTSLRSTYQKQPSRGVLNKRSSENMLQIYRKTPIPKCDFNKVALQAPSDKCFLKLFFCLSRLLFCYFF